MICAQAGAALPDGSMPITATAVQPADMSTCAVVLITGSELSAVTGISFPSPTDFGAAWACGFSLVVMAYLAGWGPGVVLRFLGRK
jgi:hypothetical protein